jgi:hypothetical protein
LKETITKISAENTKPFQNVNNNKKTIRVIHQGNTKLQLMSSPEGVCNIWHDDMMYSLRFKI